MTKKLLLGFGVLVVLFGLLVTGIFVANHFDEPLSPQVKQILSSRYKPNEKEMTAYYFLMGLYSGEVKDPEAAGRDLWLKYSTLPGDKRDDFWRHEVRKRQPFEGTSVENYVHLLKFESIASPFENMIDRPLEDILKIHPAPHRELLRTLAEWDGQGKQNDVMDTIASSNRYMRSILDHGVLLEKMIAVVIVRGNVDFLLEESKKGVKFNPTPEFLETFNLPDANTIFARAMDSEIFAGHAFLQLFRGGKSVGELLADPSFPWTNVFSHEWLMRPNETMNRYYALTQESNRLQCADFEATCLPTAKWMYPEWYGWAINPAGRKMIQIFSAGLPARKQKLDENLKKIGQGMADFKIANESNVQKPTSGGHSDVHTHNRRAGNKRHHN